MGVSMCAILDTYMPLYMHAYIHIITQLRYSDRQI
jgi:hypothetical protein